MDDIFEFGFYPRLADTDPTGATFAVLKISGEEGISRPYRFSILVGMENCDSVENTVNSLLRQRLELDMIYRGCRRCLTGVATSVEYVGTAGGRAHFRLELEPKIMLLRRNTGSEVFLNKSIPEVIGEIISRETGTAGDIKVDMSRIKADNYPKREMILRYNESSWDFISRLMEKAGIYYYFTFAAGPEGGDVILPAPETMIMSDNRSHEAAARAPALHESSRNLADAAALTSVSLRFAPVAGGVSCSGYDMDTTRIRKTRPQDKGTVIFSADEDPALAETCSGEKAQYHSGATAEEVAFQNGLAREREILKAVNLHADGACVSCLPGEIITVSDLRGVKDSTFLVTTITHRGRQAAYCAAGLASGEKADLDPDNGYHNTLTAVPSRVQFRPEPVTPVPRIPGCIPAMVEGPDSSPFSPYMDDLGRYRIKLPFDLSDRIAGNSSCWIKLMTPYGGNVNTIGMHFPLLKDTQVLVAFLDGDLDHPFILGTIQDGTGSIVNSKRIMNNIIRTPGGNLFAMNDGTAEGDESFFFKNSYGYRCRGPVSDDLMNNL